jgi:acyl-CoA thioester hydrolase
MQQKIFYHHTDAGGVVYYARYLDFLEEARSNYLAENGASVPELARQGILFVVARQEIDYKSPALYGDTLDITTKVTSTGAAKIEFANEIKNQEGRLIAQAKTVLVCVDKNFKPRPIPAELKEKLSRE